jgi:deoxyribodipyrimidine photolyase-related protein
VVFSRQILYFIGILFINKIMQLILGDQLYYNNSILLKNDEFLMIESDEFCSKYNYHKYKLAYVLTCMREFRDYLLKLGKKVHYYQLENNVNFFNTIQKHISNLPTNTTFDIFDPSDYTFRKRLLEFLNKQNIQIKIIENPNFLTSKSEFEAFYLSKINNHKKLILNEFYIWQRNRLNILMIDKNTPIGGKYSFDAENRNKLSSKVEIPNARITYHSEYFESVRELIEKKFKHNIGFIPPISLYPLNYQQAKANLDIFFHNYLSNFGEYQDAITDRNDFVFHSVLSPSLNLGIISPKEIIESLLNFTETNNISINNIEGFIRQIIGWREWMKGLSDNVYQDRDVSDFNFFNHKNKLPNYFWNYNEANTNNELIQNTPLYSSLKKLYFTGYNHHIERLMIFGNYFTINEIDPKDCYLWFMSNYIDAYEWVMKGNVLGMGLYADGGVFATKPYISGGNYLKKMSDYKDYKEWDNSWTDKFWAFLLKNEEKLKSNPRLNMLIATKKNKVIK